MKKQGMPWKFKPPIEDVIFEMPCKIRNPNCVLNLGESLTLGAIGVMPCDVCFTELDFCREYSLAFFKSKAIDCNATLKHQISKKRCSRKVLVVDPSKAFFLLSPILGSNLLSLVIILSSLSRSGVGGPLVRAHVATSKNFAVMVWSIFVDDVTKKEIFEGRHVASLLMTFKDWESIIRELFHLPMSTLLAITYVDNDSNDNQDILDACFVQHLNPL
ncbi:hypothetical protein L7F22_036334 [Adiantum nelumboides]|nr:hypothetical protein [Adiantum nelumboides]